MKVTPTSLAGVLLIEPDLHHDPRGRFQELWQSDRYREHGLDVQFVQDNLSHSRQATLRGLHYQIRCPQGKLIQVLSGRIFDVAVDLRRDSETFGRSFGVELEAERPRQIYVPPGCAHGFLVLSESADVLYKCTDRYHAEHERTLLWNDPDLGIDWPLRFEPLLSDKDRLGKPLAESETYPHAP
jgi:dTDP-4-dehydrorhamnose 3,5-epimerase